MLRCASDVSGACLDFFVHGEPQREETSRRCQIGHRRQPVAVVITAVDSRVSQIDVHQSSCGASSPPAWALFEQHVSCPPKVLSASFLSDRELELSVGIRGLPCEVTELLVLRRLLKRTLTCLWMVSETVQRKRSVFALRLLTYHLLLAWRAPPWKFSKVSVESRESFRWAS